MAENDVVYSYIADSSGIMVSIDTMMEGIDGLIESINELVDASSQLGEFEGIFEEISVIFSDVDASASEVTAGIAEIGAVADETSAQIEGLQGAVDSLGGALAEDTAMIDGLNESIVNLQAQVDMLTASEDAAAASTGGLAAMSTSLGSSLQKAQGPLLLLGMAGIAAGASMYDMGAKAEDALNQVQALAGVGASDMATYTSELEDQATQFGESLDQEAQGLFYVTSAGFKNADAMNVLAQSVMDAKAGNVDLEISSKALTGVLNAYGASADQASQYNDLMMKAVTDGTQTFGDFASAIGKAASEGNAAHISFNQVAAAESTLTDHAMTARNASQDLATMLRGMDSDIGKTATTAKSLGLNFNEAAYKSMDLQHQMGYLQDITKGNQTEIGKLVGGSAGLLAFNDLMTKNADGTSRFTQVLDDMKNSSGSAAQAFATSQDTIGAHWAKVQAALSVISYKALEALAPTINAVADAVGKAADFMSQHMDVAMPILAGLAVFFGVIVVAAIAAFVSSIMTVASPFIATAAIIGAVVAGIIVAVQHWGQITDWLKGVWSAFLGWFNGIFGGIEAKWGQLEGFFKGLWGNVVSDSKTAWNNVTDAAHTAGSNLQSWWSGVVSGFAKSPIGSSIIKSLQDGFGQVGQQFGQIGQTLKTQLGDALSGVKTSLGQVGDSFKLVWQQIAPGLQLVGGALTTAWKQVSGAMSQVGQIIATSIGPFWKALQQQLGEVASIVGGALSTAWKALSPIFATIAGGVGAQLLNVLKMIGIVLGGIVLIAISFVLGAIVGLAKGFATLVQGIAMVIGGITKVFSGVMQIASGIVAFLVDLFTGHFNKLGADLGTIWHGIVTMLSGVWDIIKGLFIASVGTLISIISGFVATVLTFFANLASSVGIHVSGLVNNVIKFFNNLPQSVINALNALPGMVMNLWNTIITDASNAGANIVKGIANGITGALHFVTDAITNVTSWISAHLPHSPAKVGPLTDLLLQGSMITEQISTGMLSGMPKLQSALTKLTEPIAVSFSGPNPASLPQGPNAGAMMGNDQVVQLLQRLVDQQGVQRLPQSTGPTSNAVTQFNTMNFNGMNRQELLELINYLQGQQFIAGQRGANMNTY